MAVAFPEMPQLADPAELHIDHFFHHLIACLEQRRIELRAKARDIRLETAAKLAARSRKEHELGELKTETERRLQMNELRDTQALILTKLETKLVEVREPQAETRLLFRGDTRDLEQLIQGVGEVVEVVPVVFETTYQRGSNMTQRLHPLVGIFKDSWVQTCERALEGDDALNIIQQCMDPEKMRNTNKEDLCNMMAPVSLSEDEKAKVLEMRQRLTEAVTGADNVQPPVI